MAGSKSGTTAEAAKLIRADIKAAGTNSELGTYPGGITFTVRTQKASFMSAIEVTINSAPPGWAYTDDPRGIPGLRQVSEDCKRLGGALRAIIARHFQADGSIYFADVQLDTGTAVPC
jgi:hypothetical protein